MEIRTNPFYELRTRLYASAAAGCAIIAEDFRLKRAVEAFKPMSEANKVFGKLYDMCNALLTSADPATSIIDCIALADALAVTQGVFADDSETKPAPKNEKMKPAHLTCAKIEEYKELIRKSQYDKQDFEEGFFRDISDPRILTSVMNVAGKNGIGIASLLIQIESVCGEEIIPALFDSIDLSNKNATGNQIRFISSVYREKYNVRYIEFAEKEENPQGVRCAAVEAMIFAKENEDRLLNIFRVSKGKVKQSALLALAKMNSTHAEPELEKAVKNLKSTQTELITESGLKAAVDYARADHEIILKNGESSRGTNHPFSISFMSELKNKKDIVDIFEKWGEKYSHEPITPSHSSPVFRHINEVLVSNLYEHPEDEDYRSLIIDLYRKYPDVYLPAAFTLMLMTDPEHACGTMITDHRIYDRNVFEELFRIFTTPDGWYRIRRNRYSNESDYLNIKLFKSLPEDILRFLSDTSVIFPAADLKNLFPNGNDRDIAVVNMRHRCHLLRAFYEMSSGDDRERVKKHAEKFALAMCKNYCSDDVLALIDKVCDTLPEGTAYSFIRDSVKYSATKYWTYALSHYNIPNETVLSEGNKLIADLSKEPGNEKYTAEIKLMLKRYEPQ